jgi:sacsin
MFPVLDPSSFPTTPSTTRAPILQDFTVRGVNPNSIPVLPHIPNTAWINLRSISQDILQYLDPDYPSPLSGSDLQKFMLTYFQSQTPETQLTFVQYLVSNSVSVSRKTLEGLAAINFVPARDGNSRAPKDLVDPEALIAQLFPGRSSSLPDTSQPHHRILADHLRTLKLFVTDLSLDILRDRIRFISNSQAPELAKTLIQLISQLRFDCRSLFNSSLSRDLKWLPTPTGLQSPLVCRDTSSHHGKTYLFDEVTPMISSDVHVDHYLREALMWDDKVPFETLSCQLVKVMNRPEAPPGKVRKIVEHVGHRSISQNELSVLQALLKGRNWVPTLQSTLVSAPFVLLSGEDIPAVGFHAPAFDSHMHGFLRQMGCDDRYVSIIRHVSTF